MRKYSNWIIIEINDQIESAGYPELKAAIENTFGPDVEFFIPIHHEKMGSYISTNVLFDGYVFVKDCVKVRERLSDVRDSRYFSGVLRNSHGLEMINSHRIGWLRRKLRTSLNKMKVQPGIKVRILEGIFENLEGEVMSMEDGGKHAMIKIKCLSREILAPLPTTSFIKVAA